MDENGGGRECLQSGVRKESRVLEAARNVGRQRENLKVDQRAVIQVAVDVEL